MNLCLGENYFTLMIGYFQRKPKIYYGDVWMFSKKTFKEKLPEGD